MPKRRRSPAGKESAAAKPASRWTRADIKHTSVYLPEAAYEALRQVAFDERRKIHDLLVEGVDLALKKRGYPALADMKAKWQRFPSYTALSGTSSNQNKRSALVLRARLSSACVGVKSRAKSAIASTMACRWITTSPPTQLML